MDYQLQRATSNFKTQLLTAISKKKMATDDVVIVDGLIRTLDLVTTIRIDQSDEENQDQIQAKVKDKRQRCKTTGNYGTRTGNHANNNKLLANIETHALERHVKSF